MKAAISLAMAITTTLFGFFFAIILLYRAHSRNCAFQEIWQIFLDKFHCLFSRWPVIRA